MPIIFLAPSFFEKVINKEIIEKVFKENQFIY